MKIKQAKKYKIYLLSLLLISFLMLCFDGTVFKNYDSINHLFKADVFDRKEFKEASLKSDDLCQKIEEDGIVLLKNENECLPLKEENTKINLFGWSSSDSGNILRGIGSGYSLIPDDKKVTLISALEAEGFVLNQNLIDFYKDFYNEDFLDENMKDRNILYEPSLESYTDSMISKAVEFSDIAVMTISRVIGENSGEGSQYQEKINSLGYVKDESRHYLEISKEERDLLSLLENKFSKVIVLINSTNPLELSFLEEDKIQACLSIGLPGQSGMRSVAKIIKGDSTPSGRLTDTYLKDFSLEPTYNTYMPSFDKENQAHVFYGENIYVGYRFYETAFKEGYYKNLNYDDVVLYPFGYGLSYSKFKWTIENISKNDGDSISKDDEITVSLSVENVGDYKGKDTILLFVHSPYSKNGIEKSETQLLGFVKSTSLEKGEKQTGLTISFNPYDFASFDCYDNNNNGFKGYEVEKGEYLFTLNETSHEVKDMDVNSFTFKIEDDIKYDKDPDTGNDVGVLFDSNSYGNGIDGSEFSLDQSYLTRSDFTSSFINSFDVKKMNNSKVKEVNGLNCYDIVSKSIDKMPEFSCDNKLCLVTKEDGSKPSLSELKSSNQTFVYNTDLISEIANGDEELLKKLVDQMSKEEVKGLVENSGFKTDAIYSISKPLYKEYDGTCGLNTTVISNRSTLWTAFPSITVLGQTFDISLASQFGESVANEAKETGVSGWYAPSCNIHRSSFTGRNSEYFSEDPILTGNMAGSILLACKENGLNTYLKHFVMAELGDNNPGVNEWNTEQALREIYLKPFEIAIKKYQCTGLMSSFNRIGATWTGSNYSLMTKLLRGEWGYKGVVISDYSDGEEPLSTQAGILAGNDMWLNDKEKNARSLDENDKVYMTKAKEACSHYLYSLCSTLDYQNNHNDSSKLVYKMIKRTDFPIWFIIFLSINGVVFVTIVIVAIMIIKRKEEVN